MPRFSIPRTFATTATTTISPTIVTTLAVLFGAATLALPAAAQLAPPQWSRPAMDSTHVTGTAARVMPEIVAAPPQLTPVVDGSSVAPKTIPELLLAFDGTLLDMPGNQQAGAFEQIRFQFSREKMQVQFTANWQWFDSCVATATAPRCTHGINEFFLSPEGLFVTRRGCGFLNGSAGGNAEFRWTDFQALGGAKASPKHWTLQRDTLWANCQPESGSSG